MCNECCKEFRSWCGAFTRTEILLSLVHACFMLLFITVLTILIIHLTACFKSRAESTTPLVHYNESTEKPLSTDISTTENKVKGECTWSPSHKTEPATRYYARTGGMNNAGYVKDRSTVTVGTDYDNSNPLHSQQWDGAEADDITRGYLMALVKMKPSSDIMFGCTLTIISDFWAVTAASCIESIEEVDTLDSFVMMEGFGENAGSRIHTISDVMIHPEYQGSNTSYDICVLRSEDKLTVGKVVLGLPTMLDNFLTALGERLTILGYGKYRSVESDPLARGVRVVSVHVLPRERCAGEGEDDLWAVRHLDGGVAAGEERPPGVTRDMCAAAAGSGVCRYCAGTPLLRAGVLLALMGDWRQCGISCAPAPYVSLAPHVSWLRSLDTSI